MKYYDRNGDRLDDVLRWAQHADDPEYRHVAHTTITDDANPTMSVAVFTSWIGLDSTVVPGPQRPALIFETLTLNESTQEVQIDRWATESAARVGHAELVALVMALVPDATVVDLDAFGRPASADTWVGAPLPPPLPAATRS